MKLAFLVLFKREKGTEVQYQQECNLLKFILSYKHSIWIIRDMFSIMNVEIQILFTTFRCYKFHILFKKDTKIIYTYLRASFLGLTDNIDMKDFKHLREH